MTSEEANDAAQLLRGCASLIRQGQPLPSYVLDGMESVADKLESDARRKPAQVLRLVPDAAESKG